MANRARQQAENLQQHQQNVAKLRQFEQQLRQPAPTDRALGFTEPAAARAIDPIPPTATPAVPAPAAKGTRKEKQATPRPQTKSQ